MLCMLVHRNDFGGSTSMTCACYCCCDCLDHKIYQKLVVAIDKFEIGFLAICTVMRKDDDVTLTEAKKNDA